MVSDNQHLSLGALGEKFPEIACDYPSSLDKYSVITGCNNSTTVAPNNVQFELELYLITAISVMFELKQTSLE